MPQNTGKLWIAWVEWDIHCYRLGRAGPQFADPVPGLASPVKVSGVGEAAAALQVIVRIMTARRAGRTDSDFNADSDSWKTRMAGRTRGRHAARLSSCGGHGFSDRSRQVRVMIELEPRLSSAVAVTKWPGDFN